MLDYTHIKQSSIPTKPYPILAGDYGVFVVGPNGKLQYATMISFFWLTFEGAYRDHKLYLLEDIVSSDRLPELIAHEGAHAYVQLLEESGIVPVSQYDNRVRKG